MKLIALGDSCTYGQNVRASEAWPAVLERLTGHDVRNVGVCGDTTRLALERFPKDVQLHSPDCVILQFGMNDANRWASDPGVPRVSRGAYVENVREMVHRIWALDATALVLRPHTPQTADSGYNKRVALYATAQWDVSKAEISLSAPEVSLLDDGYGVHPDPAMHERYAQLVADAL